MAWFSRWFLTVQIGSFSPSPAEQDRWIAFASCSGIGTTMKKKSIRDYLPNESDNFWLIDETFLRIAEKEKKEGTRALRDPERVVGTIWHVYGIIGNGGIPYFSEFTFDVEEVARAYETLGMRKSASILRKAISKFPNSQRPKDFTKCMDFIDEHEEYFMSLSTKFWETQNDIEEILAS